MNKSNDIQAVCLVGSVHELLLYILYYGKEQCDHTHFFVADALSKDTISQLKHYTVLDTVHFYSKPGIVRNLTKIYQRITAVWKWPFLRTADIYGFDHLWFSCIMLRNRTMVVLEDGTGNYNDINFKLKKKSKLSQFFGSLINGPSYNQAKFGAADYVTEVLLTGIMPVPKELAHKARIVNLYALWNEFKEKQFLEELFCITKEDMLLLEKKTILVLTQDIKELNDKTLATIDKILLDNEPDKVLIKPHPLDTFNYKSVFPQVDVYTKKTPAELLYLFIPSLSSVYSYKSTADYYLPANCSLKDLV